VCWIDSWGNKSKEYIKFECIILSSEFSISTIFRIIPLNEYYEFSDYIQPVEVGWNRLLKILMDQTLYFMGELCGQKIDR
jgi:hypothetical protein